MDQEIQHRESQLEEEGIRAVNVSNLFELLGRQHHRCALTGRPLTPADVVLDHINPVAASSDHSIDNVQLVVHEANRAKGCMSNDDFIALCLDVAAVHGPCRR